ncbi:MAG TPA: hypothetical protein VGS04_05015 [Nitrososphaerales archaeon]|nr:hypothetical protein [Nitrososphaerales archaeon]
MQIPDAVKNMKGPPTTRTELVDAFVETIVVVRLETTAALRRMVAVIPADPSGSEVLFFSVIELVAPKVMLMVRLPLLESAFSATTWSVAPPPWFQSDR